MLHLQQKSLQESKWFHSTHHVPNCFYQVIFKATVICTVGFLLVVGSDLILAEVLQIKTCPICCYCHVIATISAHSTSDAIVWHCALFALLLTVRWKTLQPLNGFLGNQSLAKTLVFLL